MRLSLFRTGQTIADTAGACAFAPQGLLDLAVDVAEGGADAVADRAVKVGFGVVSTVSQVQGSELRSASQNRAEGSLPVNCGW